MQNFYIFNSIFIYVIPYSDVDGDIYTENGALQAHWILFKEYQYLYVAEWEEFDSNDKVLKSPIYKLPLFPQDNSYRVELRPSTDEVFIIKR